MLYIPYLDNFYLFILILLLLIAIDDLLESDNRMYWSKCLLVLIQMSYY